MTSDRPDRLSALSGAVLETVAKAHDLHHELKQARSVHGRDEVARAVAKLEDAELHLRRAGLLVAEEEAEEMQVGRGA